MANITCTRCSESAPQMEKPPIRGKVGLDIQAAACQECWDEWTSGEVMIINEYRLNLADPEHRKVLYSHMRKFFNMES
jgi:Fe-S cluster biosynthesis and repair protein YggX